MVQTLDQFEALRTSTGEQLLTELAASTQSTLTLAQQLRRRYPAELVAAAMTLSTLREKARDKLPNAENLWLTRAGLEQASPAAIADHRAQRFASIPDRADLCTGIGGDLLALAATGPTLAVDKDPLHLAMAMANVAEAGLGDRVTAQLADVREVDLSEFDALFIDPARRDTGGRFGRQRSEPPLEWCLTLSERVARVAIKCAPGLDLSVVPAGWETECLAEGFDLKETLLWSPDWASTTRRATVLRSSDETDATSAASTLEGDPEALPAVPVAAPGAYLIDPNPAVTRAGLVERLAAELTAWKIDEQIAFLSTDRVVATPFGRTYQVIDSLPWNERQIARRLRELGIGAVDIRRRGLPGDVEQIRRRLKLRGDGRATLAMTRHQNQPWCLVLQPATPAEAAPL